nr:unnamed protein product [Digitaria exilis]
MPSWWGKSSSKEVKKTAKENLIDTFQRLISPNEQKGSRKSRGSRRHGKDSAGDKGCWSTAQSRSTSPSKEVSRCQSFAVERPHAQPLPLPGSRARVTRTTSDISNSKSTLEKHGKGQLLPLPRPQKRPEATEPVAEEAAGSVSSNCSIDSDDAGYSRLQSLVGNEVENGTRATATNSSRYALRHDKGEMCAMKEVTLFSDDPKSKESAKQLCQEISLLSRLQHPNIVRYYGSETVDNKLYIYLEYVSGGSIHKLLQEYGQFGEQAIRSYTKQILLGLAYLHAKNTVHRDIKGANILVDPNGRVKLADFGMAKHINGQQCPFSFKGSPYWMAPEVVGHARNMSSLGLEGQSIFQRRAAKFSFPNSELHIRSNISCPVSPCGSPLLRSRSPQHQNGRMSPSPISSPRTTSGASTPLTGGSGAIPLNHVMQPAYRNEGFKVTSRGLDDHLPSRPADPVYGRNVQVQQLSAGLQERVVSEADILSPQFGRMRHANVWDSHNRPLPSERSSQQSFGDNVQLKPSLDLRSGSSYRGRNHGQIL